MPSIFNGERIVSSKDDVGARGKHNLKRKISIKITMINMFRTLIESTKDQVQYHKLAER